uniref:Uncharacterized protein n=1 Tax=Heterosigma akashiwo TaxID=2829 RepID=A0A6V1T397_HETAK
MVSLRYVRADHQHQVELVGRGLLDGGEEAEGGAELPGHAVVEHRELAVRGHEGQRPVLLKVVEPHALVEVAVVEHHPPRVVAPPRRAAAAAARGPPDDKVLVQRQPQLGVPRQVGLHLDGPIDGAVEHVAVGAEEHVQPLDDVHEDLVPPLARHPHGRAPGGHGLVGGRGGLGLGLGQAHARRDALRRAARFHQHRLIVDEVLEELGGGALREAVVQHLVQQLVHQHEVLPDALLREDPAVVLEDAHEPLQQLQHQGGRHVPRGGGREQQAALPQPQVGQPVQLEHRRRVAAAAAALEAAAFLRTRTTARASTSSAAPPVTLPTAVAKVLLVAVSSSLPPVVKGEEVEE